MKAPGDLQLQSHRAQNQNPPPAHYSSPLLLESTEVQGGPAFRLALQFHQDLSSQLHIAEQSVS